MYQIGVVGSAGIIDDKKLVELAREVGKEVAKNKCLLITGGLDGLPYEAAKGAKSENGITLCVSPASSEEEHISHYRLPLEVYDFLIFTGFGFKGRNIILVRSCNAIIAISGNVGTLNEITAAYGECRPIGILTGSRGIADEVKKLEEKHFKKKGGDGIIIYESDPKKLVKNLIELLNSRS